MPKHVTEDDLASGLAGFGDGLTSINETRPRRDSPFRDTGSAQESRREDKVVDIRPTGEGTKHAPEEAPLTAAPEPDQKAELLERARAHRALIQGRAPETSPEPQVATNSVERVPTIEESARNVRISFPEPASEPSTANPRKADVFTERVTLLLSTEMRDSVEQLARELQRRRTKKDERITANTVMRVAIKWLLEELALDTSDVANSEAELFELVASRLKKSNEGVKF